MADGVLEVIRMALNVTDKIIDRMPTYEQSKREKMYRLRRNFEDECAKEYPYRDDNKRDIYRREIMFFLESFARELEDIKEIKVLKNEKN
jgi:hypothetical protein